MVILLDFMLAEGCLSLGIILFSYLRLLYDSF